MANKKMLKTYHGIPKTPIDDNTVFYASFDGTNVAEVGGALSLGTGSYKPIPTGLGYKFNNDNTTVIPLPNLNINISTFDFMFDLTDLKALVGTSNVPHLFNIVNDNGYPILQTIYRGSNSTISATIFQGDGTSTGNIGVTTDVSLYIGVIHIRVILNKNKNTIGLYVNGILKSTASFPTTIIGSTFSLILGRERGWNTSSGFVSNANNKPTLADFMVSNIDAGSYFPTLPQDFIDGKARISPAFNVQRKIFEDPLTSQYIQEGIGAYSITRRKHHTVTQATAGQWTSGDTVKIKGIGGEIISGVIDSDTALAKIIGYNSINNSAILDSISAITDGDCVKFIKTTDGSVSGLGYIKKNSVGELEVYNDSGLTSRANITSWTYDLIVEITVSSSTPTIKYNNAGTMTAVTGTWTNLGTNEATFTLGTNAGLTNQDLTTEYSLNMVPGQGAIPEVLTTTLGGEANAKVYDSNFTKLSTDYKGKISGSVVENPNIFKSAGYNGIYTPSQFTFEETNTKYDNLKILDGILSNVTTLSNTYIAQQLFSFDLIALVERKYGTIPGATVADKVTWLKNNITTITANWYGYGSCPSGNKAYLTVFVPSSNTWSGSTLNNTSSSSNLISYGLTTGNIRVADDGFIYFLAYTDASNGTIASTIYTDYISLDVQLSYSTRFQLAGVPSVVGKRNLAVNPTVHVRDDYAGKIAGSVVENPNIVKITNNQSSLLIPSDIKWSTQEDSQTKYDPLMKLDGAQRILSSVLTNGVIMQSLFSFNIIEMLERKFGPLPCGNTLAEKIAWAKVNINKITGNWYGYGLGPNGNKAKLIMFRIDTNVWETEVNHIFSTPSLLYVSSTTPSIRIDNNGFCHFLAYTDAAAQLVSQVPYNTTTWAEWNKSAGIVVDSTGVTFTANGTNTNDLAMSSLNFKPSTKYGLLYNVVSTNLNSDFRIGYATDPIGGVIIPSTVGNQKVIRTSLSSFSTNRFDIFVDSTNTVGTQIKLKDIQIFELPAGSTIESDFNTMTADQLVAKYPMGALPVIPSTIYTDYIYLDLVLNTPTGYDVLSPENPRRDNGQSNLLLVRKETKEIQTMFPAKEDDGIVLYGDYIPYQGFTKQAGKILATSGELYVSTSGTGAVSIGSYKNVSNIVGMSANNSSLLGQPIYTELQESVVKIPILNNKVTGTTTTDGTTLVGRDLTNSVNKVVSGAELVNINGELYMKIKSKYTNDKTVKNDGTTTIDVRLPNRPLVK